MALYTPGGAAILKPEDVAQLLVLPVQRDSIAMQVATVITTGSHEMRIPVITTDPVAAWAAEGSELNVSDADLDEINVVPAKVAGLSIISRELADDSSPAAAEVIGAGLARDIATRVDQAFFGNLSSPAPAGLGGLTGVTDVSSLSGGWADLDPIAEAISEAEQVGATLSALVTNPATALEMAQLKDSTGSNKPLITDDVTRPGGKVIFGLPLYTSPAVGSGVVWGLDRSRVMVVLRKDTSIDVSDQAFFSSDRVAVRAIMRVAFGFPHAASVVKIKRATGSARKS